MQLLCTCWTNDSNVFLENQDFNDRVDDSSSQRTVTNESLCPGTIEMTTDAILTTLQLVENILPSPAGAAVSVAIRLIEMCQDLNNVSEQMDELRKYIETLSLLRLRGLLGENPPEEIPRPVKEDIEQLESDLCAIKPALDKISRRNRLVNILLKNSNARVIDRCSKRLKSAFDSFQLTRQIKDAMILERLQYNAELTCAMLRNIPTNMDETKKDMNEIRKQVQNFNTNFRQEFKPTLRRPHFPRLSSTFLGREKLVKRLVARFTTPHNSEKALVALLGPGGMGKTSVGLAVMEDHSVRKRFGDNQFWVPCEKAESVSLLLDTLYESLRINRQSGKTLDDILEELEPPSDHTDSQPFRIILLDNFETPWNLKSEEREGVKKILLSLMRVSRVSILITMRASQPPTEEWKEECIMPLEPKASAKLYKSIFPKGNYQGLLDLLSAIGYCPLVITLVARYAQSNSATPAELLDVWRREGTDFLGGEQEDQINRSIRLSVDSPPMEQNPHSLRLLAFLALFPGGVPAVCLEEWLPPSIDRLKTLSALSTAALIEQRDGMVMVIPVIRSYVLHTGRIPTETLKEVREHVRQLCCSLLARHESSPGDPSYLRDKAFISSQETNFQSILLDATSGTDVDFSPKVFKALLALCWHQIWTRPRLELIEHTLSLSKRADNKQYTAQSLACYGEMCIVLARLKDAIEHLTQAHDEFINLGDQFAAANCSIRLLEARMHHSPSFEDDLSLVRRAKLEYGTDGEALCFLYEGKVYWQKGDRDVDALCALNSASQGLKKSEKRFESAHCSYFLSRTYHRRGDLEEALRFAQEAVNLYLQCGYGEYVGRGLIHLSNVLEDRGNYNGALRKASEALDVWSSLGSTFGVAQALHRCGSVLLKMDNLVAAHDLLSRALVEYNWDDQDGYARTIFTTRCEGLLDLARRRLEGRDAPEEHPSDSAIA
ncbi:hypothetical protein VKT23_005341 [Stygiomarasmius scandens]|uniref:Novel STAND NTPase 1 domain-containing protein n=1 Tax=Marasmiellus scandens TaxID=2682957 RepID=A0ABR1JSI5_9AGAR